MTKAAADRMTLFVAAFGVALTVAAQLLAGGSAARSVGAGAALASLNFVALRLIVVRVVEGDLHRKGPFFGLIFLKMGALMALVYWLLAARLVEPIAFAIGMSSLVVGLLTSAFSATRPGLGDEPSDAAR